MALPSLYAEYAAWFHLLTHPDEYREEATAYLGLLREAPDGAIDSLLEMGSGLRRSSYRRRRGRPGYWSGVAKLMGIINVTPDSFSDGGLFLDPERAIRHGRELASEGAAVLDVGGESTRPGAEAVSPEEERRRVEPVIAALAAPDGPGAAVSIDTSKLAVAAAALDAGATMVNDVTALRAEPELAEVCAERGCEVVLMHMQGTPRTMQERPTYGDVVEDVKAFLAERIEFALSRGVAEDRIWIDPGVGFGKTVEHNLELLRRLGELRELGRPLVVGTSRKSFIGRITGREAGERLGGTIASNVLALAAGAEMLRVHDVAELRDAITVAEAILSPA